MSKPEFFPIISNCRVGMAVLWEDAEKAFLTYSKQFPEDTIEALAAKGGFGVEEFVYFYHGFMGPIEGAWPTEVCQECRGSGEIESWKCSVCRGAGALLPKEHPGTFIR